MSNLRERIGFSGCEPLNSRGKEADCAQGPLPIQQEGFSAWQAFPVFVSKIVAFSNVGFEIE